jgi:methylphosphotriester-DNA--protein-cysteine methyltransferase
VPGYSLKISYIQIRDMNVEIHKITNPILKPHVEYILFNYSDDASDSATVTSFANANVCLGILMDRKIETDTESNKFLSPQRGVHSYLSGLYLPPHRFKSKGCFDEICIDFTPLGYYHFFKMPFQTYVLDGDVLREGWGRDSVRFFETVFECIDRNKRGLMIEKYLLSKFLDFNDVLINNCLYHIRNSADDNEVRKLTEYVNCTGKTLTRKFSGRFDLTPKDYFRIIRFRKSLKLLAHKTQLTLTDICYRAGFYDQSHFYKELNYFTERSPGKLRPTLHDIDESVLLTFD